MKSENKIKDSKPPYFPLYAQDFMLGTLDMPAEIVGGYIRLLCHQWDKGFLPIDEKKLCKISGLKKKNLELVLQKFRVATSKNESSNYDFSELPPQFYINDRLQKEREKAEDKLFKNRQNGKNGGRPKTERLSETKPKDNPTPKQSESESESDNININNNNTIININEKPSADFDVFLERFNWIKGTNYRGNGKIKKQFQQRISEGYTMEMILAAAENCHSDPWHQQNPKYLTPEFITRPDKLETYVNYQSATVVPFQQHTKLSKQDQTILATLKPEQNAVGQ